MSKKTAKFFYIKEKTPTATVAGRVRGGHLEFGERIETCAERETMEEAGITIKNIKLWIYTNDIFKKEDKHYVTVYVIAEHDSGEPRVMEPDKCECWDWFEWDNLPRPLFLPIENLLGGGYDPFD